LQKTAGGDLGARVGSVFRTSSGKVKNIQEGRGIFIRIKGQKEVLKETSDMYSPVQGGSKICFGFY